MTVTGSELGFELGRAIRILQTSQLSGMSQSSLAVFLVKSHCGIYKSRIKFDSSIIDALVDNW